MTDQVKRLINDNAKKLMVVDKEFADEIESLSSKMKTTPKDVLVTALELLKLSLSREVTLHKPNSSIELKLPLFKALDPEIKIKGED